MFKPQWHSHRSVFGSFPSTTYSYRILGDVNVPSTYEEPLERARNFNTGRVPMRRCTLANIRSCDNGIGKFSFYMRSDSLKIHRF